MYLIGSRHLMLVVDLREQKRHVMAVHTRILTGKGCKVGIAIATFVQKSLTALLGYTYHFQSLLKGLLSYLIL